MKLIPETRITHEIEQLQKEIEDVIRREMVRHKSEEIESMVIKMKPVIKEITAVNDPMSHDKLNLVCILDGMDRAIFLWDNKSLEVGMSELRHEIYVKLSKMRGSFYV
jgi:hypothetical protein